jgi:predicted CxxxxCH...CXXCH cytochrome family protein
MKRPITNALATLMLILSVATTVHALESHNFACVACHASSLPTTSAINNVCLVCHKSGSVYGTNKQFYIGDMANPFGTSVSHSRSDFSQSSHNWAASDNFPSSGAVAPTNSLMNTPASIVGILACNRCHRVHNESSDTSRGKPLLRMNNDEDQMCLNCHRLRDTNTHVLGSHPINVNFNTIAAANPTKYNNPPLNPNPLNPTSAPNLINGKVLCSTCHRAHYADSDSSTFDNRTSVILSHLSPSKGYLLRADYRSKTVDAVMACTSCHKGKFAHNGGDQRIQCTDCHGGHVEYDHNAVSAEQKVPNVYTIKRYMNWSSSTGWKDNNAIGGDKHNYKQTLFQDPNIATTALYKRADGKGVCQSCHDVPIYQVNGNYPIQHGTTNLEDAPASMCTDCHNHNATQANGGSFGTSCNSCHGRPPQAGSAAAGYPGNEGTTAHMKHSGKGTYYSFGCKECHYSAPGDKHKDGNFRDVFTVGYYDPAITGAGAAYSFTNITNATCSVTYCHSNGQPAANVNPAKIVNYNMQVSPNWFGGTITTCDRCHEASPTTNAHAVHLALANVQCGNCHSPTVNFVGGFNDKSKHINRVKDIEFAKGSLPFAITGSNCSTVYCHTDGRGSHSNPIWTDDNTGKCGTCHGSSAISTGAHQGHLSVNAKYGLMLNNKPTVADACNVCHGPDYKTKHLSGAIDNPTNCATSCHKNGYGSTVSWTSLSRITDCTTCHNANPSVIDSKPAIWMQNFASLGHGQYTGATTCTSCHDANSKHIGGTSGAYRVYTSMRALVATPIQNSACIYCHNDAGKVANANRRGLPSHVINPFVSAPEFGSCSACHDLHGTTNKSSIRTTINGRPVVFVNRTSGFITRTAVNGYFNGLCQVCHTRTNVFRADASDPVSLLSHYSDTGCLDCHSHRGTEAKPYAFGPGVGGCGGCHGYPPVESMLGFGKKSNYSSAKLQNYSGGGGAHSVKGHIPLTAVAGEGWANCTPCHSNSSATHAKGNLTRPSTVNVTVDPKYKFNANLQIRYSSNQVDPPARNATGSCTNVSCHFQPTPKWSTQR